MAGNKLIKRADDDWVRWHRPSLAQLPASSRSEQSQRVNTLNIQDGWALLCLHTGIHPSKACQPRPAISCESSENWCLVIEPKEEAQQPKTTDAYRTTGGHSEVALQTPDGKENPSAPLLLPGEAVMSCISALNKLDTLGIPVRKPKCHYQLGRENLRLNRRSGKPRRKRVVVRLSFNFYCR